MTVSVELTLTVEKSLLPEENTCPGLLLQQVIKYIFNLSRTLTFGPAHLSPAQMASIRWPVAFSAVWSSSAAAAGLRETERISVDRQHAAGKI